jgi:hypothetical protein
MEAHVKNAMRTAAGLLLLAIVCAAAGCTSAGKTRAYWVRKDGGDIDADAVNQARAACEKRATGDYEKRARRHMNIDWAAIMRECMDEHGYVLITKPRE